MRIVQVCPYDLSRQGGVQQHIKSLAAELRKGGHEVLVLSPGNNGPEIKDELQLGRMRRISLLGTSFELALASRAELQRLAARLKAWRPDVLHYHTIWVPFLPWQIFRQTSVASVATFHDTPPPGLTGFALRTAFKLMSRFLLRRLDGAIAVSPAPLAHLRPGQLGVRPKILPPATDLSSFFAVKKATDKNAPLVLFVGRLEPRKGIQVLLDAWEMIADGRVPLPSGLAMPRLVIAGSGELGASVEAAAARALLRHVPAPDRETHLQLLSQASLAVSPALYGESFGIILVEALASGTPVIAASNAGYVNVLTGPGRELLVPPGNPRAIAEKILRLLAQNEEREGLVRWGRAHAGQFDVSEVTPEILVIYREAMAHYARSNPDGSGSHA